jgi:nucleoside-diphosphate-sugar epimerase
VRHSRADVSAAHTELGYRPTVSFEEGLERTIADLESRLSRRPEQIALS